MWGTRELTIRKTLRKSDVNRMMPWKESSFTVRNHHREHCQLSCWPKATQMLPTAIGRMCYRWVKLQWTFLTLIIKLKHTTPPQKKCNIWLSLYYFLIYNHLQELKIFSFHVKWCQIPFNVLNLVIQALTESNMYFVTQCTILWTKI